MKNLEIKSYNDLELLTTNTCFIAKFAISNKNNNISEYIYECSKDEYGIEPISEYNLTEIKYKNWVYDKCILDSIINVTKEEYEVLTTNLLDDNMIYRNKGGNFYIGNNEEIINIKNFTDLYKSQELLNEFKSNNARKVIVIKCDENKKAFVVDPQGYSYARYIGLFNF